MRIDLDVGECGTNRPRHIARGFCPACGPGEELVDLQWGTDADHTPLLRSESQKRRQDAEFVAHDYSLPVNSPCRLYRLLRVHMAGYACFAKEVESFCGPWDGSNC
jgi:hypothetical protein